MVKFILLIVLQTLLPYQLSLILSVKAVSKEVCAQEFTEIKAPKTANALSSSLAPSISW